ncbi:MAG TPA: hypothetical protein VFS01_02820 [Rhizomicrobium sp.]|jgi:hypothetical protein|nr:hypothetical protein [Rhizomicrobium sp.]
MTGKYSREELLQRLNKLGWRSVDDHQDGPAEGSLRDMATQAHARYARGQPAGRLQEIATRIEVDLIQLEELWHHLGLPV